MCCWYHITAVSSLWDQLFSKKKKKIVHYVPMLLRLFYSMSHCVSRKLDALGMPMVVCLVMESEIYA